MAKDNISEPVTYRQQDHAAIVRALDPEPARQPAYQFGQRTFTEPGKDLYRNYPKPD